MTVFTKEQVADLNTAIDNFSKLESLVSARIYEILNVIGSCYGVSTHPNNLYFDYHGDYDGCGGSLSNAHSDFIYLTVFGLHTIKYNHVIDEVRSLPKEWLHTPNEDIAAYVNKFIQDRKDEDAAEIATVKADKLSKQQAKAAAVAKLTPEERKLLGL